MQINGITIPEDTGSIIVNGVDVSCLHVNGEQVWCKDTGPNPPGPISDFSASDNIINRIDMTWSPSTEAERYDIYEGSTLIQSDVTSPYSHLVTGPYTGTFHVKAINTAGSIDSNSDSGTALEAAQPPSTITDFSASDDRYEEILMTWSDADEAESYD